MASLYFNSRPSARGDTSSRWAASAASVFQFTPLREGRLHCRTVHHERRYFNSRPSARGDSCTSFKQFARMISIHAPPRGATRGYYAADYRAKFQFTPLREGRHDGRCGIPPRNHFNSRPSARGDLRKQRKPGTASNFNSRPSARGDARHPHSAVHSPYFNSRPSARGDLNFCGWVAKK